jgi:hypothetical protein
MRHALVPTALVPTALVALALLGCQPATTAPTPSESTTVDNNQGRTDVTGTLLAPSGEVAKATVVLKDEAGKELGIKSTVPQSSGTFVLPIVPVGADFAVATCSDGATQEALFSTSTYYNPISVATSLVAAYAHAQLDTRLLFIEDLPAQTLGSLGAELEAVVTAQKLALGANQEARLAQFNQVKDATIRTKELTASIESTLQSRVEVNEAHAPSYATDAEYADKKKKLGL